MAIFKDRLFFDIETMVHPQAQEWLDGGEITLDDLTVSQLKDVLKAADETISGTKDQLIERIDKIPTGKTEALNMITRILNEMQDERDAELLAKAPLDPDLGAIRSIGAISGFEGELGVMIVPQNEKDFSPSGEVKNAEGETVLNFVTAVYETETDMLEAFWTLVRRNGGKVVGYNILNFDLPYLIRRSMDLEVPPHYVSMRRYQTEPTTDLQMLAAHWGALRYKSLDFLCKRYGIENPLPELDGSMVKDMDDETLCQYNAVDVWKLRELWKRMNGYYWPLIEEYTYPEPNF